MDETEPVLPPNPYTASLRRKRVASESDVSDEAKYRSSLGKEAYLNNNNNPCMTPAHGSSNSLYHHYSQDIKPQTGCILLGKDGETGNKYTTRFKIDMSRERAIAEKEVLLEECFLCSQEENQGTMCTFITSIMMSEAFLLSFHLTALTLGVAKNSINREEIDEDLELVHTILEILVVSFVLFARCMLIYKNNKAIKSHTRSNHHLEVHMSDSVIVSKRLKTLAYMFYIMAVFLDITVIIVSVLFYFVLHLGWTTLINNAVLIIATVFSNIVLKKMAKIRAVISEDEHKVVLYEAALLLNEGQLVVTDQQRKAYFRKVTRYIKSLMDTRSFRQPGHIELMDKYGPRWNTVTTMELMSTV